MSSTPVSMYDIDGLLKKYLGNKNIGPFKHRFRLSIFQINYSIDGIEYRTALHQSKQVYVYTMPSSVFF
jgi:hypothetical protein